MELRTVRELKAFREEADRRATAETGKARIWGDADIPPMVEARGSILYQDDFPCVDNWHHEGLGGITCPEPNTMQIDCLGSRQGAAGCMAFCREDLPDGICIEYDMRALTNRGLLITFIAAAGRCGGDMITDLPEREGVFADYIFNPDLRCYHVSVSRYDDNGKHTGVSNWRRNPGAFMMAQQEDLCETPNTWYHVAIVKKGRLLQMAVGGKLAGGFIDRDEIPEPIPAGGKVGFRAIGADVRIQVRSFRVTSLE